MNKMSVYVAGSTWLHALSPGSKILYAVLVIFTSLAGKDYRVSLGFLLFSLILLFWGGVLKQFAKIALAIMIVLLSIAVINGLFYAENQNIAFSMGGINFYHEGLLRAMTIFLQILNLIAAVAILTFTSKPDHIIYSLIQKGMPYRWGYMLGAVLQIIPQMTNLLTITLDAQKARGIETDGTMMVRLKALFPAFMPVVVMSLLSVKDRAMALEVRGFAGKEKKTFLHTYTESAWDKCCQVFLLLLAIILIVYN